METQPHISIWIEPGTTGGDLLERILAKNGITTESIIAGMKDVSDKLLTPESLQIQKDSWVYFENTPEWRAEASQKRETWHAANP